jgi:hypothetical protein
VGIWESLSFERDGVNSVRKSLRLRWDKAEKLSMKLGFTAPNSDAMSARPNGFTSDILIPCLGGAETKRTAIYRAVESADAFPEDSLSGLSGSGGGTRTPDPRIMIPVL